jgi:hypothetical protein
MNAKIFKNLKTALEETVQKDRDYIFIRHTLKNGEGIRLHYHEKANEWVALDSGCVHIRVGKEEKEFCPEKGEIIVIKLPKLSKHSLIAKSNLTYFVLRDQKDKTTYIKKEN